MLKEYQLLYLDNDIPINRSFYCNNGDIKARGLEVHVLDNSQAKDCTGLSLKMIIKVQSDIFEATVANGLVTVLNAAGGIYQVLFPNNMGKGRLIAEIQISNAVPEVIVSRKFSIIGDGSLTSDGSISELPQGGLLWNVITNEAQRQADFVGVLGSLDVAVATKYAELETTYAPKLTSVESQLAETKSKVKVLETSNLSSAVIHAQAEKYQFDLRSASEWDAVTNASFLKGVVSPTIVADLRAVRALEQTGLDNITIQGKMYVNKTQSACYIGYNNLAPGVIDTGTNGRVYVGISGNGFGFNDNTTFTLLVPKAEMTDGWYIVTLSLVGGVASVSIVKEDSSQAKSFVVVPHIVLASNIQIGAYNATDNIKDLRYIAYKDTTDRLLVPYINGRANYKTPIKRTVSGVPTFVHLPANYNPDIKNKCCIWFHGSSGYAHDLWLYSGKTAALTALLDAGYVVIGSDYTSRTCWGNAQSMVDIADMISFYKTHLNLQDDFYMLCESMGGAVSFNCIARDVINAKAVIAISPAINLENLFNAGSGLKGGIQGAYGIVSDAEFEAKTSGFDSYNDFNALDYEGVPFRIYASYADTIVSRASNADLFAIKVPNVTVITTVGEHGDGSAYKPTEFVDFFNAY